MFLLQSAWSQQTEWTAFQGTTGTEFLSCSAPDPTGGIVLGGSTTGAFDGYTYGSGDGLLLKYTAQGQLDWLQQWDVSTFYWVSDVAVDSSGAAYAAGFARKADGNTQIVLKKLSHGLVDWTFERASSRYASGYAVELHPSGDIVVAGTTTGSLDAWILMTVPPVVGRHL